MPAPAGTGQRSRAVSGDTQTGEIYKPSSSGRWERKQELKTE